MMGRGQTIAPDVLRYIQERQGEYVYIDTMRKDLGLSQVQIQGAVGNLRNRHGQPIEVIQKGTVWRWSPNSKDLKSSKRVFEEIGGPTKDGTLILECEDGSLWKAVEL